MGQREAAASAMAACAPPSIGIVTSARSDFGLMLPLIRAIAASPALRPQVYATGMHHNPQLGHTIDEVRTALPPAMLTELPSHGDGRSHGRQMAAGLDAFAAAFEAASPDLLLVIGDRYDMLPAAIAALAAGIPLAHISGGEVTEGVIDDAIRHAVSKLAHLHFVAHPSFAARLIRMGEEPWRVHVVGEPGLDGIASAAAGPREAACAAAGLDPCRPFCLLTLHPESLQPERSGALAAEVFAGIGRVMDARPDLQLLLTYPNADPGHEPILAAIAAFAAERPACRAIPSLGRSRYLALLPHAAAMIGNSSSGLIESGSFGLPVVNIGDRQAGRLAPPTVTSVPADAAAIADAITQALAPERRQALIGLPNPYGDGAACARILAVLNRLPSRAQLLRKRFHDG